MHALGEGQLSKAVFMCSTSLFSWVSALQDTIFVASCHFNDNPVQKHTDTLTHTHTQLFENLILREELKPWITSSILATARQVKTLLQLQVSCSRGGHRLRSYTFSVIHSGADSPCTCIQIYTQLITNTYFGYIMFSPCVWIHYKYSSFHISKHEQV